MAAFSTRASFPLGYTMPYTRPITAPLAERLYGLGSADIDALERREATQLSAGTWTAVVLVVLGVVLVNNTIRNRV